MRKTLTCPEKALVECKYESIFEVLSYRFPYFGDFSGYRREKPLLICPVLRFLEAGYIKPFTLYRRSMVTQGDFYWGWSG